MFPRASKRHWSRFRILLRCPVCLVLFFALSYILCIRHFIIHEKQHQNNIKWYFLPYTTCKTGTWPNQSRILMYLISVFRLTVAFYFLKQSLVTSLLYAKFNCNAIKAAHSFECAAGNTVITSCTSDGLCSGCAAVRGPDGCWAHPGSLCTPP